MGEDCVDKHIVKNVVYVIEKHQYQLMRANPRSQSSKGKKKCRCGGSRGEESIEKASISPHTVLACPPLLPLVLSVLSSLSLADFPMHTGRKMVDLYLIDEGSIQTCLSFPFSWLCPVCLWNFKQFVNKDLANLCTLRCYP